jgi:hypothetical protein
VPGLVALFGVGAEVAGQFLVTAGDNADRIHNEAAFAKRCGIAPQRASSGRRTGRHRLSRSRDRPANSALYIAAITRMRHHELTRAYFARRIAEGLTKREIIRCLSATSHGRSFRRSLDHPPWPSAAPRDTTTEHRPLPPHPARRMDLRSAPAPRSCLHRRRCRRAPPLQRHRPHTALDGKPPISRIANVPTDYG